MTRSRAEEKEADCSSTVAIIGGGFAGATLAAQLLRKSGGAVSVALIERGPRLGSGVAYGTKCGQHLLNVRAQNMSAHPDDPEHFLRWARLNRSPRVKPGDFLPRQLFGHYVGSVLQQEIECHPAQFRHVQDEAVALHRVGDVAEIRLRSGRSLRANRAVLAMGNFPPGDPHLPGKTQHSRRYVSNPWASGATRDAVRDQRILLIGSGLTSVDIAIALRGRGFAGTVHILSRRGLLPQSHQATAPWPPFWNETSPRTLRGLLRLIRMQVEAAERMGSDWRAVIDSLRPFTQEIWRSLSRQERRRFLRHVRPYWEVHRHRIAPEIASSLATQMQSGQMATHAGRIMEYREDADAVDVTYRDRDSGRLKRLRVDRVINCTGPESDCRRIESPMLSDLLRQKLVRPDPLFLGLDASTDGALIDAFGDASDFLYTLGPARKGSLWETTAVPEIRRQAAELADHLFAASARIESVGLEETLHTPPARAPHSAVQHLGVPRTAVAREAGRIIETSEVA
jgi:uncharacterized NAD(P)/FAD-binding protein YdhS